MKKYILILLPLLFSASCTINSYPKFDYNKSHNPWIDAFKDQVFFTSLEESYKSDTIMKLIQRKDAFNPYDALSLDAINKAKQLGIQLIKNMPPPVMCESCGNEKNYFMATALHYYNSRELDSIAKAEFKKYKAHDKKIWRNF
jgi:hypothetical protein